jgi:hypothetical protein
MARLLEKVGMRAGTFQVKVFVIGPVNQKPVWSNVAFTVMFPNARKGMISIPDGQNLSEL